MSQIKEYLEKLGPWKRGTWLGFVIGTPILMVSFMIWLFSLQGSVGLFVWFPVFSIVVIFLIVVFGIALTIAILDIFYNEKSLFSILRKVMLVFFLISIILPISVLGYVMPSLQHTAGNSAPQLLMCDGTGKEGIPDMAVTFWTGEPTKSELKWGVGSLLDTTDTEATAVNQHTFVLKDLKPDTEYWYRINGEGDTYKFTTPPATNDKLKFALSGDPHFGRAVSKPDITVEILEQIIDPAHGNDIFFMLGDFVEYGFMDGDWKEGLDAFSPYTTRIPFRAIIGNHDTILGGADYYKDYFYPDDMPLDTGSQFWYRIDVGNIHFFLLDLEWGIETYTAEQKAWFEKEIATVEKDDWTIVMSHCFYYSSGNIDGGMDWSDQPDMINTFEDIFIENDVDLVFSGHNHHAEVLSASGIYYFIAGTFGSHPDRKATITSDASEWYHNMEDDDDFGFFEVDINGASATLTFRNRNYESLYQVVVNK